MNYFKTDSREWHRHTKNLHLYFNSVLSYIGNFDFLSFTYNGDNGITEICPIIQNVEFLWGPVIIPFIPGIYIASDSGKKNCFEMRTQQSNILPDNIICIVNGKEVYPHRIYVGLKEKDGRIKKYENYWEADTSVNKYPNKPDNWGKFELPKDYIQNIANDTARYANYSKEHADFVRKMNKDLIINTDTATTYFYFYVYSNVRQSDIQTIDIYFKDNSAAPLFLKRKRGLQYVFKGFPFSTYR
jgi:hypothetical protein